MTTSRGSKRSLETDSATSSYATPTKKTRTPSEEQHPSLFPRPTPAVNKSRVEEVILPCDPEEAYESPQSPDAVAPTENTVKLIPTNDGAQLSAFEIASEINRLHSSTCRVKPFMVRRPLYYLYSINLKIIKNST